MFKLIYFEIRKSYLRVHVIVFMLIFLILNLTYSYNKSVTVSSWNQYFPPRTSQCQGQWDGYNKLLKKLDGKLTEEKVNFVIEENNRLKNIISEGTYSKNYDASTYTGYNFGDYYLIKKSFYDPIRYMIYYSENNNEVVKKANDNIEFYKKYENHFEVKRNEFIKENYSGRKITEFYETESWNELFNYYFSDFLIILMLILALVPVYVNERTTNMDELILSTQNGKYNLLFSKIIATFLFVLFLVLVFSAMNLLQHKLYYGLSGFNMPLYAIEAYKNTPLNLSVFNSYLFLNILKVIGGFVFALWILLFSACSSKVIIPFIISLIVAVVGLFVSGFFSSIYIIKSFAAVVSPFTLLMGHKLFNNLLGLNIFGGFYLRSTISILLNLVIASILLIIIGKYGRNEERKVFNFCLFMKLKRICLNKEA